jgi:hypothetical protein
MAFLLLSRSGLPSYPGENDALEFRAMASGRSAGEISLYSSVDEMNGKGKFYARTPQICLGRFCGAQ